MHAISHLDLRKIDAFVQLYQAIFPQKQIGTTSVQSIFKTEPATIWLCTKAHTPDAAEVLLGFLYFWDVVDELQIIDIGVHPDFRRQGVAKCLLSRLLETAQEKKQRILLEVAASNDAALNLYRSLGFVKLYERPQYYVNKETAIVMRWG